MADKETQSVLRRKLAAARVPAADGVPGADRAWRLALARAARDAVKLALDVTALTMDRGGLSDVLERVPERALIAVLQGPAETLGVLLMSPEVMASVVEIQTIGKVNRGAPPVRKPTRTDAAMAAGLIDAALEGLEVALEDEADLDWAGGYRYGSHLDDARPLGLLLDDREYRVMTAQVSLGLGQRTGTVILALPAAGQRAKVPEADQPDPEAMRHAFSEALSERVAGAACTMVATLARLSLPLAEITALSEGVVLPLRQASIERIRLEGLDGRILGEGRLGQNRGMRAVRLVEAPAATGLGGAAGRPPLPRASRHGAVTLDAPPPAEVDPMREAG